MTNWENKSTFELKTIEASYLAVVDSVTPITGAIIIRALGEIRAELDRRGE